MAVNKKNNKDSSVRINTYTIVYGPMNALDDPKLRAGLDTVSVEMMEDYPEVAVKKLSALHDQYPNNPTILNNLAHCYQVIGDNERAAMMQQKLITSCPDYLFGRINMALTALSEKKHEIVPVIFNNCYDIKDLYPNRNKFHVTEVLSFAYVMGKYLCCISDVKTARIHYDLLCKLTYKGDPRNKDLLKDILAVENRT